MRRVGLLGLAITLSALGVTPSDAKPGEASKAAPHVKRTEHITATLVADAKQVEAGGTFRIGVRFQMKPHWHIYWHSPGTTGLPTKIRFKSGDGARFGPLE